MKFIEKQHFRAIGKREMLITRPKAVAMDPSRRCQMSLRHSVFSIRHFVFVICTGTALMSATVARAAECPEDKALAHNHDIDWKDDVGIRRKTLTMIDLNGWRNIGDLRLRMRRLTIPPGGIIPTHEHTDRPSLVYFVKGEAIEHNSKCGVSIVHRAGEWGDYRHWWENKTDSDVVLIGVDIVPQEFLDDPKTDEPN
jgi:quercetin dioxygenase-like cupin family protein